MDLLNDDKTFNIIKKIIIFIILISIILYCRLTKKPEEKSFNQDAPNIKKTEKKKNIKRE